MAGKRTICSGSFGYPNGAAGADGAVNHPRRNYAYLAIGQRTLQRRLKQSNVQFGDLLDQVRLELVKQQLQSNLSNRASLAYQLGLEDPNSFYRLYRQWVADGKLP